MKMRIAPVRALRWRRRLRFWVARLLSAGYIYTDIVEMTGASTATISRVNRCLNYGKGGYRKALERVKEEE